MSTIIVIIIIDLWVKRRKYSTSKTLAAPDVPNTGIINDNIKIINIIICNNMMRMEMRNVVMAMSGGDERGKKLK